jgi:hypothetical protein
MIFSIGSSWKTSLEALPKKSKGDSGIPDSTILKKETGFIRGFTGQQSMKTIRHSG